MEVRLAQENPIEALEAIVGSLNQCIKYAEEAESWENT